MTDAEVAKFEATRYLGAELLQAVQEMQANKTQVVRTLHGWEQWRKQPSGAVRTLLTVARNNPKALLAALVD